MAGGTFKLSQPKVRPGVYANLKNGRQPTASGSARGTASIPLIGYDWGPRGKWIIISADSPDGHVAELGRSVYDETNSSMIMLQLLLLNAATVYVYIPDGGAAAKKTITVGSGSLTVTAKYKGTLGNTVKIVSVANPVDGFDVSVVINGSEVELFEGIKTMDELKGVSEYVDFSGTGEMAAFASATLEGGTDTVDGSGNSGISDFLDKSEKVRLQIICLHLAWRQINLHILLICWRTLSLTVIPQRHSWEKHIKTQLRICTPQGKTLRQPHLCWRLWQIKVERVLKLVRHWEL